MRPAAGLAGLDWRAASHTTARAAAGSAAALLRLAEGVTLAYAAGARAVIDLTGMPTPSSQLVIGSDGASSAPDVAVVVEDGRVAGRTDPEAPPVPHWDELNLARIRGRLPGLGIDDLTSLLSYEQAHAARPPVLAMLDKRISKVRSGSRPPASTGAEASRTPAAHRTTLRGAPLMSE